MKKTLLISSILILGLFFLKGNNAQAQDVYYVSATGSDNNPGTKDKPFLSVAKACSTVVAGTPAIIYLEKDAVFNVGGTIGIGTTSAVDVQIIGNNTSIRCNPNPYIATFRPLRLGQGSFKLKGLVIENGRITDYNPGGAIFFIGNLLEIDSCTFQNNYAGAGGGAIASRGKKVVIKNSYFYRNQSGSGSHGAAILHTGNKTDKDNSLEVVNCTFEENSFSDNTGQGVLSGTGTAIGNYDPSGSGSNKGILSKVTVINSTFINNHTKSTLAAAAAAATIQLDGNMPALTAYIANNSFYGTSEYANGNVALRVERSDNNVYFINNLIAGIRHGIYIDKPYSGRPPLMAYNNTVLAHVALSANVDAANEFRTEDGNITQSFQKGAHVEQEDIDQLKAEIEKLFISYNNNSTLPYLAITNVSSPLVDSGLNNSSSITTENIIPLNDAIGTPRASAADRTGTIVDRGAIELIQPDPVGCQEIEKQTLHIYTLTDRFVIENDTQGVIDITISHIDGRAIASYRLSGAVSINKSDLPKGLLIIRFGQTIQKLMN